MTARIALGAKVKVAHIYEWPTIDLIDPPDEIRLTPAANPHAARIGVVVGKARRMICKELDDEGEDPRMVRTDQTALFYVVRYTLTGRGYLTDARNIEVVQ